MGRSYTIRDRYKGDLHQLGSAQLGSPATLKALIIWNFGSMAAYTLLTYTPTFGILQPGISTAWQLGSLAARQINSSEVRQLGSFVNLAA